MDFSVLKTSKLVAGESKVDLHTVDSTPLYRNIGEFNVNGRPISNYLQWHCVPACHNSHYRTPSPFYGYVPYPEDASKKFGDFAKLEIV
nr:unnamed protein product [Spirometra erinaceieuropaei]